MPMSVSYSWRSEFHNEAVDALHSAAFKRPRSNDDWWAQVNQHSLGWVCAELDGPLVGFVNVAWDGGTHAFVLDVVVLPRVQRQGIGTEMVAMAIREARKAGCEWLHVDFEARLRRFYLEKCGFESTNGD